MIFRRAGDSTGVAQGQAQLQFIRALQRRVEQTGGASLASLRAEITAAISAGQSVAQATASAEARAHSAEAIHAASEAAHREVSSFVHDFYDRKEFDPYLRFASAQDEEEYRKREAERRAAIEKEQAKGTPEGNRSALNLSIEQMEDAGAHGADQSDAFRERLRRMKESRTNLESAMENPVATKPAPPLVDQDLLATLKEAGVTVADQDASGTASRRAMVDRPSVLAPSCPSRLPDKTLPHSCGNWRRTRAWAIP